MQTIPGFSGGNYDAMPDLSTPYQRSFDVKMRWPVDHDTTAMSGLRREILDSPVAVALDRARTYTRVFRENETAPWIVTKAMAFREHLGTIPLFIRAADRIAGYLTEIPGGMPVHVEIGIGENGIFVGEDPHRRGYLRDQVPPDIAEYWRERNLWGRHRAFLRSVCGRNPRWTEVAGYQFISYQGHLSPSYAELLEIGLDGIRERVRRRSRAAAEDPEGMAFLRAAEICLEGVADWIERNAEYLADRARQAAAEERREDLVEMARIAARVAHAPPDTFREAMQLIWFCHQAIHIEGHGYSCTPDRLDQLLYPYYRADKAAGRITDDQVLTLCENFILKMRDNSVWSVEHNLTQGLCVSGSTPDGQDQTNELSWLFIRAADHMATPEPLVWMRWHPTIDPEFFDFCLETLAGKTCFPLMMSDTAVSQMLMALGASREDAFAYVPAGCNELAIPGKAYFNPGAYCNYLGALEAAMTRGRGYAGERPVDPSLPEPAAFESFAAFTDAVAQVVRRQIQRSYEEGLITLRSQMRWGQTPFTSCLFEGCIDRARDMIEGTTYNIMACGGTAFANMVDSLAAIRELVYSRGETTLAEIAAACAANYEGCQSLHGKIVSAPKHGNDIEGLRGIVECVQQMRDEAVKEICRDPRDGTPYGNSHVVRSGAVRGGLDTGATPDGRLAGTPLAGSIAAAAGAEKSGPTAVLNSILMVDPVKSWQCGYNVNLRFQPGMLADPPSRAKVRAMLDAYFRQGGQEMQINCVDADILREALRYPERHRDLVVRISGFSEFFTKLSPEIQEDVIARVEHRAD